MVLFRLDSLAKEISMLIRIACALGIVALVAWYLFFPSMFINPTEAGTWLGISLGSGYLALLALVLSLHNNEKHLAST